MIACDISLLDASRCFSCLLPGQGDAAELAMMGALIGADISPSFLMRNASCLLRCVRGGQRQAVELYLMAQIESGNGGNVDHPPILDINTLLDNSRCFECLNSSQIQQARLYLIQQIFVQSGGYTGDFTVPGIMEAAKCILDCLLPGQMGAAHAWMLSQLAASTTGNLGFLNPSIESLLDGAKCFLCLTDAQMDFISLWFWCRITNTSI